MNTELAARRSDLFDRLASVLARLDAPARSVPELFNAVPELICKLGFDRAMISRVSGGVRYPQQTFVVDGEPGRVEEIAAADVVGDRHPVLVTGAGSYVAAPIISGGQVVGMLHADCRTSGRALDEVDRDVLAAFAVGLRMALAGCVLHEQLLGTRQRVALLSSELGANPGEIAQMPLVRARNGSVPHAPGLNGGSRVGTGARLPDTLTSREREVLGLMAGGCTNTAIAQRLMIADGTAKKHVFRVLRKLGVTNRSEAVACWFRAGEDVGTPATH